MAKKGSDPVSTAISNEPASTAISNEPASTAISNEPPTNTITINLADLNNVLSLKAQKEQASKELNRYRELVETYLKTFQQKREEYNNAVDMLDEHLKPIFRGAVVSPTVTQSTNTNHSTNKRIPGTSNPKIVEELKKLFKDNKQIDIKDVKNQLAKQFNCPAKDVTASMETIARRITTGSQGLSSIFELK